MPLEEGQEEVCDYCKNDETVVGPEREELGV